MAAYTLHRVTALPGTLAADSLYFVAHPTNSALVELFVTGNSGSVVRKLVDVSTVQGMIDASIAASSGTVVYDTFANLPTASTSIPSGRTAYVVDATDDPSVNAGGATYILRHTPTPAWVKISESESMDLSLSWASLTGKPSSTPDDIDDSVAKRHAHSNMTQLNKIGESNGLLTYNGKLPTGGWETAAW